MIKVLCQKLLFKITNKKWFVKVSFFDINFYFLFFCVYFLRLLDSSQDQVVVVVVVVAAAAAAAVVVVVVQVLVLVLVLVVVKVVNLSPYTSASVLFEELCSVCASSIKPP